MKTNLRLIIASLALIAVAGCSHGISERKAPCPPSASLSKNPCDHIPINLAEIDIPKQKELAS